MLQAQSIPSVVRLNVGGHYFTTSLQTLTKDSNSKLTAMFSPNFKMKPGEDGAFFIDRNGTHFRFILNYLRTGKLTLPEGARALEELKEEAEFYQIQGLVEDILNESVKEERLKNVKLNVGGHYFTTSLQTLTKDSNSMLAAMFSGKFDMKPAEDGAFFIDRDGTHFRFILNYLRTGKLTLPEEARALEELKEEAEFYQIQGLIEEILNVSVKAQRLTTVKLNVGGDYFRSSLQTLTKDPNSKLAAMFKAKFEMKPAEDGSFFIDRDGTHFRYILSYLRTGKLTVPEGATFLEELQEDVEYFQIQGLQDELELMSERVTCMINLNVGGQRFTTTRKTLTGDRYRSGKLYRMFSKERGIKASSDGTFFIDRDGKHFRYVLNYLRDEKFTVPPDATLIRELKAEASFYEMHLMERDLTKLLQRPK
ncbi:BTB/POZ domain-containing protein KCTD21 [Stylophora pistillata]|uniref:BTB/POZ domain-containing protein KCTD21 n=1 Tax=Stylophora pistillata TaxID=50429 RepID=A0A2B4SHP5_STYPI|nr:BTB/POZ domain-containing protein KCTD21 [Stylophora pistillata]